MTDLDLTQRETPAVTLRRALIIFLASVLAMIPGWLLGAYIPLWIAPLKENLMNTLLMYLFLPCLLWGIVPPLFFKWRGIALRDERGISWFKRYALLIVIWVIGFLFTFSQTYPDFMFFSIAFNLSENACEQVIEDAVVSHYCWGSLNSDAVNGSPDVPYIYRSNYTFEGREGLPFVWYTGEVEETVNPSD